MNRPFPHSNRKTRAHNSMHTQSYQPESMGKGIPLPYYLKHHEVNQNQHTNFTQITFTANSLQMTMNPNLMGRSSNKSKKPLMVFTKTDAECNV